MWLIIWGSYKLLSHDAPSMRHILLKYVTCIWSSNFIQGQRSWCKLRAHIWFHTYVSNKHCLLHAWCMTYSQLKSQWPCFDLSVSSNVNFYNINCNVIYGYYVCSIQTLIKRFTVYDLQPLKFVWPLFAFTCHHMLKVMRSTEISYMCFIQTLVIAGTVPEILTQIDHKGHIGLFVKLRKLLLKWINNNSGE